MLDIAIDKVSPNIFVGKGMLELLSNAMYINPLTLFREYVQNAVDAIDDAVAKNHIKSFQEGHISVNLDQESRRIIIRDNGSGIANKDFMAIMLAIGDSPKRGTDARGFRGVGRLSGLGYAQQLIFRSRSFMDSKVMEIIWNGRIIKHLLAASEESESLETLVRQAVTVTKLPPDDYPIHFFEVELIKPRRIANDKLMNEVEIADYLGQVAPCPFAPEFSHGAEISKLLAPHDRAGRTYAIHVNNEETPIYRPYRDTLHHSATITGKVHTMAPFAIEGIDGRTAAVGWRVHHDYQGAIPIRAGVCGLRARIGNMQVGGERIFAEVFPEDRFCSWSIGEIHILDPRVTPNGRRDAFESNTHLDNIIHHLYPIGADIARHCRVSSQKRNRLKTFRAAASKIYEKLDILQQDAVSEQFAKSAQAEISKLLAEMRKAANFNIFDTSDEQDTLTYQLAEVEESVAQEAGQNENNIFTQQPAKLQKAHREIVDLIYACSANPATAKVLVDRILERL
ncbi:MAG: ATP-binding protein [Gammaproteobacteria bacterium]|nr:ATP-binding protein [Gammaproteobacteria bacterium]